MGVVFEKISSIQVLSYEETDLVATVTFKDEVISESFLDEFETLWSPEFSNYHTCTVFVFDTDGYEQLVVFLNDMIGPSKYDIVSK